MRVLDADRSVRRQKFSEGSRIRRIEGRVRRQRANKFAVGVVVVRVGINDGVIVDGSRVYQRCGYDVDAVGGVAVGEPSASDLAEDALHCVRHRQENVDDDVAAKTDLRCLNNVDSDDESRVRLDVAHARRYVKIDRRRADKRYELVAEAGYEWMRRWLHCSTR